VLASKVDGILAVIWTGHTQGPALRNMVEQIGRAGARIVGVALNRVSPKSFRYYTGNRYNAGYYEDRTSSKKRRSGRFPATIPGLGRFFKNGSSPNEVDEAISGRASQVHESD
jgi:hypothetical protein